MKTWVGTRCNGVFTPGLIKFGVTLQLQVTNPHPEDLRYIVKLCPFRASARVTSSLDVHQVCPNNNAPIECSVVAPISPTLPPCYCIMLFVDYNHKGKETQLHLATAHVNTRELDTKGAIELRDGAGNTQAVVTVRVHSDSRLRQMMGECEIVDLNPEMERCREAIAICRTAYTQHVRDRRQVFVSTDTSLGPIPIPSFLAMAVQVECSDEEANELFDWIVQDVCTELGFDQAAVSDADLPELLGEVLTRPLRDLVYEGDSIRVGAMKVARDQWSRILTFPNPERAAFDCEDGSLFIMQLAEVLRTRTMATPLLIRLSQQVRESKLIMAIAELLVRKNYVAHALVIGPHSENAKALALESTARVQPTWNASSFKRPNRVSHCEVLANRMYRNVFSLVSAEEQLICLSSDSSTGIAVGTVLLTADWTRIAALSPAQLPDLPNLRATLPATHLCLQTLKLSKCAK